MRRWRASSGTSSPTGTSSIVTFQSSFLFCFTNEKGFLSNVIFRFFGFWNIMTAGLFTQDPDEVEGGEWGSEGVWCSRCMSAEFLALWNDSLDLHIIPRGDWLAGVGTVLCGSKAKQKFAQTWHLGAESFSFLFILFTLPLLQKAWNIYFKKLSRMTSYQGPHQAAHPAPAGTPHCQATHT